MLRSLPLRGLLLFVAVACVVPGLAHGQIGGKLKRAVERAAERKVDKAIDDAVKCVFGDSDCIAKAEKAGKKVVVVDAQGKPMPEAQTTAASTTHGGGGDPSVWHNYDFTPGKDVWFASDFAAEPVGRFPAKQLEFVSGNMQIVEIDGERALESSSSGVFRVRLPRELPPDFALEFDIKIGALNHTTSVYFSPLTTSISRYPNHYLSVYSRPGIYLRGNEVSATMARDVAQRFKAIKLQADGEYLMVYADAERVSNIPNATFERTAAIEFRTNGNDRLRTYIKNIVVSVGVDKLYDSLVQTGEFTTRGILFDVDSATILPASTPTLEAIHETLRSHADLSLIVEGHTDSSGDDAHNLQLSLRRAEAVVAHLAQQGIDGKRLRAAGKGETEPAADNATAEGRAQNRRVVLRRIEG